MKHLRKRIIVSIIVFMIILSIMNISNAGLEVKEGTTAYVNVNVSESFDICYNLRDGTSTLGNCELDPHMATCLDWGAVAYLAHSRYGANSSNISTNTTGNKSGVMNMSGHTHTATMFENRNKTSSAATIYRYRLEEVLSDSNLSKYVDIISNNVNEETTKGRAIMEMYGWYGTTSEYFNANNTDSPMLARNGLFSVGQGSGTYPLSGYAKPNVTFRPIIWN